ncbi:MAG TPA: hypothetical protein VER03_13480 [Bryobacteraceae bacterium]|nr:hypothetical protein [Bryobacteraceae bacterium]
MNFLLAGFKEGSGSRNFSFDCVAADRSRTTVVVGADMALARKYAIRLQELPLLCVRLLESLGEEERKATLTLTEGHMMASQTEARLSVLKKTHRQSPARSASAGQAWRNPA